MFDGNLIAIAVVIVVNKKKIYANICGDVDHWLQQQELREKKVKSEYIASNFQLKAYCVFRHSPLMLRLLRSIQKATKRNKTKNSATSIVAALWISGIYRKIVAAPDFIQWNLWRKPWNIRFFVVVVIVIVLLKLFLKKEKEKNVSRFITVKYKWHHIQWTLVICMQSI